MMQSQGRRAASIAAAPDNMRSTSIMSLCDANVLRAVAMPNDHPESMLQIPALSPRHLETTILQQVTHVCKELPVLCRLGLVSPG